VTGARGWFILLAACAVTFAATTIYLWHELAQERAAPPPAASAPPPPMRVVSQPVTVIKSAEVAGKRINIPAPGAGQPDPDVDPTEYQRQQSRQLLEQLANPASRARLLEEARVSARNAYPWIAERLKLGPEEYDKLIETLARSNLEAREAYAKCTADPACDLNTFGRQSHEQQAQPVAELLGPERMRKFETYQQTMNERETVLNLRGRLPDTAYLSTEASETLVNALAEESLQFQLDAGQGFVGFGMNGGWIYYRDQGTTGQRYQSAESYVNRMIARAAQVLSAEQLRYFTQMQQDLLANLRGQLEKMDDEKPPR